MTESKAATASSPQPQPQPQPKPKPKPAKRVMRSQGEWKTLLEAFNNSGLTKAAFCKQHRIATSSLYRWQSIFSQHNGDTDFIDVTESLATTPAPPAPERDNPWQVELALGDGIVLRLRTT